MRLSLALRAALPLSAYRQLCFTPSILFQVGITALGLAVTAASVEAVDLLIARSANVRVTKEVRAALPAAAPLRLHK